MTLARKVAVTTTSLVAGRALALLAGIGATALATRYLGVSGFGALTLAMAIVSLAALLTDLGLSMMAAREIARAPQREREILGNVLSLGLAFSVVAALVLIGLAEVAYAGDPDVRRAILVLSIQLFTAPFLSAARAHFQAGQRGQLIAIGDVALAVAVFGGSLICVEADLGFTAMVGAVASGYVAQAVAMTVLMRRKVRLAWAAERGTWRWLLRLSLPLGATMIINYLYFRLDVALLSILQGQEDVAVYGVAYRVLEGLMVLPAYFMLALFPEIARLTEQRERVDAIVRAALSVMEAIAIPLVLFFAVFADQVIRVIADDGYGDAAWVLRILTVALGVSYLNGVYGNALPALGRQSKLFRVSVVVLGCNLAINLALIPPFGVIGAAVAVAISELVAFVVVRRLYGEGGTAPRPTLDPRMLLAAALMVVAVAPALLLPDGLLASLLALALAAVFGTLVYAGSLIALGAVPEPIATYLPKRVRQFGRDA
jgi:O-antigen/teichoic acid export membrane protein